MKLFLHFSILLALLAATSAARAQTTINAASCNQSDVQKALSSVSGATVVVNIPAGTCGWTGNLSWAVPSSTTSLTIQGQTAVNCTGTAGTAGYACTAADQTIIQDNFTSGSCQSPWIISLAGANTYFRMTGLTIAGGTGNVKCDGILVLNGPSHNVRLDHIHFDVAAYTNSFSTFTGRLFGEIEGVLDHNIFDNGVGNTVSQGFAISNTIGDSEGFGDGTWANPTSFGSNAFIFLEDNVMHWGEFEDCDTAGRFVARYNNLYYGSTGSAVIHSHGTKTQAGRGRGCRAYEAYGNYIVGPSASNDAVIGAAGGPSLVWGNTLASGFNWLAAISTTRSDGSAAETNTPNGWGYCGTAINGNGVGSQWDGNSNASTGYPCMDGIGRGQGQALNGKNWPNALNSTTSSISWPHQYLEPSYYWENSIGSAGYLRINTGDNATQLNRDIYYDASSFDGSSGTGHGAASARPSTCTAGPGGTYGQSPTGSYGVAYFADDTQTLSVCTASNTWTNVYTPYTYPHPLTSGVLSSSSGSSGPQPPTNLTGTVVQ